MRIGGRESFFWNIAQGLGEHLGREDGERGGKPSLYARLDRRFRQGLLGNLSGDGYDRTGWQFRFRRYGMRCREESVLLGAKEALVHYLSESAVGYVGLFFLLVGLSFLILVLIVDELLADGRQMLSSVFFIFLAVPLMTSSRSVASVFGESFFTRRVLCGFCGRASTVFPETGRGEARPMTVLLLTALSVLFAGMLSPYVFFCGLLLFFGAVFLLSVPEVNLPLILFLFPFLQLSEHPTLLLLGLVLILYTSFFSRVYCGRRDFSFELADLFVFLFCFLLFWGGMFGYGDAEDGIVLSLLAGAYFPFKNLLSQSLWRRRARASMMAGAAICALFGIFQYFFTELELRWVDASRFFDIGGRVCSFFDNPNMLAVYLLLCFPVALCGVLDAGERALHRCFFGVGTIAILICLILTWSRGAWLGILLEVALTLLFYSRRSLASLLFSLPFVLFSIPWLPQSIFRRFMSIGNLADSSIRYRIYTWRGVVRMIGAHPFGIGVGEDAFHAVYPQYALSGIETVMHAHCLPLQITAELGVMGSLVFFAAVGMALLKGFGKRRTLGAPYALCGVMTMGFFDHLWYAPGMILLLFAVFAFCLIEEEGV